MKKKQTHVTAKKLDDLQNLVNMITILGADYHLDTSVKGEVILYTGLVDEGEYRLAEPEEMQGK